MQRIIKRFLLHKQTESDDIKVSDFDELKQDLQMVRYEVLNDMTKSSDDTLKFISLINNGMVAIGDEIVKESNDLEIHTRFKQYQTSSTTDFVKLETNDLTYRQAENMAEQTTGGLSLLNQLKRSLPQLKRPVDQNEHHAFEKTQSESNIAVLANVPINEDLDSDKAVSLSELHVISEKEETDNADKC
jgi:hypothetical protein